MDPLLLTPGPLTTSPLVRAAMQRDLGSRDPAFTEMTARVRRRLAKLAPEPAAFTAIPLQGSGTYAVEAMLGTLVPPTGGAAVLVNGVYGARAVEALRRMGRTCEAFATDEGEAPDLGALAAGLAANPRLTHVFTVHSETTTGQLLPLAAISELTARAGRRLLVDAMSSLGAIPVDGIVTDAIASSANKCLEGVPGLSFVLVRTDALAGAAGAAPSLSLDLHAQWARLEKDGQFRFTPRRTCWRPWTWPWTCTTKKAASRPAAAGTRRTCSASCTGWRSSGLIRCCRRTGRARSSRPFASRPRQRGTSSVSTTSCATGASPSTRAASPASPRSEWGASARCSRPTSTGSSR